MQNQSPLLQIEVTAGAKLSPKGITLRGGDVANAGLLLSDKAQLKMEDCKIEVSRLGQLLAFLALFELSAVDRRVVGQHCE